MPIVLKDIIWLQTENVVTVKVPAHGIHSSKMDIFISKGYIKASFAQFFYEAVLLHLIDVTRSSCTLTRDWIVFELIKAELLNWETLELNVSKPERLELKKKYIEGENLRQQDEDKEKTDKKHELKRVAVREQMSLDAINRKKIETIKNEEKNNALKSVDAWCEQPKLQGEVARKAVKPKTRNKQTVRRFVEEPIESKPEPLPAPRQPQVVNVSFTPREFPTPSRESRLEEENEWLATQAQARRSVGFISEDIRPEERNPQFLKAKGDEFFRNRNFLGAVSAYSFGIKLNENFVDLYLARSEAHTALGNYYKMVQDCSKALELMKPEVPANLRERALCIGRRGIGLLKLGMPKEGMDELKASLRLVPNDTFKDALEKAEEEMEECKDD